mgnify:CR=1 FL=1
MCESELPSSDYLVGWMDGFARGRPLGRSVIHVARYLEAGEDPLARESLRVEAQGLPSRVLGVPRSAMWRLMRPLMHAPGVRAVNAAKYHASRAGFGA